MSRYKHVEAASHQVFFMCCSSCLYVARLQESPVGLLQLSPEHLRGPIYELELIRMKLKDTEAHVKRTIEWLQAGCCRRGAYGRAMHPP